MGTINTEAIHGVTNYQESYSNGWEHIYTFRGIRRS